MEIRHLIGNGVSISEISRMLGVDRGTVKKYADKDMYGPYFRTNKKSGKLEPHKEYIKKRLGEYPLSAIRIHEEISKVGYTGKLTILRDYMRSLRHEKQYHAVMEFETNPGQQAQIDWASFGKMMTDEGERPIYGFTMILGYSRMRYTEFTHSMNVHTLLRCHMNAYEYVGGAAHEHLYDNMKQVVLVRRKTSEESEFHPLFSDFAAYYGIKPKLCRVRKPRTKGKVERAIQYIQDDFFLGLEFTSLDDLNMKARIWMEKVNSKPHATTKEPPLQRLEKEKEFLIKTVERLPYRISEVLYRKARCNCKVSVFSGEYSVPPQYANRDVEVRVDEEHIAIFYRGNEIAKHKMVKAGSVSFLDAHKKELEEHCYYFPKKISPKREPKHVPVIEQLVETRDLSSYEEG